MNRSRTSLTAPGPSRTAEPRAFSSWKTAFPWGWSAAVGCAALAGCGTTPGLVTTYSSGAVAPPAVAGTAVVASAEAAVKPMESEQTEPIIVVAAERATSEPVRPATYQDEGEDEAAVVAPPPAPMPGTATDSGALAVESVVLEPLTLAEAEGTALARNPTLAGAMAAVRKARGIYTQVGLRPNPTLGVTGDDIGEDGSAGQLGMFASQTFVRGNKLELNRAVESWEVQSLELQAEAQRLRTLTDVRQQFVRVVAAQQRLEIAGDLVTLAESGVGLAEDLLNAGEVARPDVLQAQIQLGEVRITQQNAEVARDAAWRSLMAAIGTPGRPVRPVTGTLEGEPILSEFEELLAGIVASSPEIAAARARVEQAKAAVCRQRVQPIPNVNAQATLSYGTGGDEPIGGFQIGLPLPVHNDNRGNIAAAIADVHRSVADLERLELNLRSRLATALAEYESAQNRATRLAEDVLPAARENLDLSEQGYRQGEFDAIRVVTARRSLFEAELSRVSAASDRQQAAALIDGLLLSGSLTDLPNTGGSNLQGVGLRGEALSGQ